jgi:hypothetical protein
MHLHTCPALSTIQKNLTSTLNRKLEPILGKNPRTYHWNSETAKLYLPVPPRQPDQQLQLNCICQSKPYGTYHKCTTCNNLFHLHCIGANIKDDEVAQLATPFQCKNCNPNRPYLFNKTRDWEPGRKGNARQLPRGTAKKRVSYEILITNALKISSPKNRAKFLYHQENRIDIAIARQKREAVDNKPEASKLMRACLGYLPEDLVKQCYKQGKKRNIPTDQIRTSLVESNIAMIQTSHNL